MNRKILIILIIFSVFISIGAVSAENVTDDSAIAETFDNEVLLIADDGSSFSALNATINSGKSVIEITKDYTFDNKSDAAFIGGIPINTTSIVINGNNHTIDSKNQSRCFKITGISNIVINDLILKNTNDCAILNFGNLTTSNVEFTNGWSTDCAAVFVEDGKYSSKNDRFIDNHATVASGGAISASESVIIINNGFFKGNRAEVGGGAILSLSSEVEINDCLFEENSADKGSAIYGDNSIVVIDSSLFRNNLNNWSAVYLMKSNMYVLNTAFVNSTSRYATAIYSENCVNNIKKSRFINLSADITAGALGFKGNSDIDIEYCDFINSSSAKNGGAIFADINGQNFNPNGTVIINQTLFRDCISGFGGAVVQLGGKLKITFTDVINNIAVFNGGAIYTSNATLYMAGVNLTGNGALSDYSQGGAIFLDDGDAEIEYCAFVNNKALVGGAIYAYDSYFEVRDSTFLQNVEAIHAVFAEKGSSYSNITVDPKNADTFDLDDVFYPYVADVTGNEIVLNPIPVEGNVNDSYFDLRKFGAVTPVKNQGSRGACWAFGANGALESAFLKATNISLDLSENNVQNSRLRYSIYGSPSLVESGTVYDGMAYYLSWLGIVNAENDVYDELGKLSPILFDPDCYHILDAVMFNPDNITSMKEGLVKYGALTILVEGANPNTEFYNNVTYASYCNNSTYGNHYVTLVGWNDTFSKDNFKITPPGDGAWICKNSWGADWGDEGYFYLSYYDAPIRRTDAVGYIINNTDVYDRLYQYDFGFGSYWKIPVDIFNYTNAYQATDDDWISAVGTYFNESNREYSIYIEVNGNEVYSQSGESSYAGYHTIKLDNPISIRRGDNFTVTIQSNLMPFVKDTRLHFKEGTSFITVGNDSTDISATGMVACIKVYTVEDTRIKTTLITPQRVISVNDGVNGYDYQFILKDANGTGLAGKNVSVLFFGKKQTVTTDENGWGTVTVNANEEATYDIEVRFEGDDDYTGISQTSTIKLVKEKTEFIAPNRTVYVRDMSRGYTYSAILKDADGKAISNRKVLFIFNGKKQVTYTDEKGYATVKLTAVNAGTQTVTIRFAGDRYYRETETTRIIKIVRESTKLTVADKTFVSSDVPKKITATLKSKSDNPVYGAKVTLTVGGKTYSATTDNSGVAVFNIDLTKLGIFTATTKFADSRFYAASRTTSKITII